MERDILCLNFYKYFFDNQEKEIKEKKSHDKQ